jgi:hypothetical protein
MSNKPETIAERINQALNAPSETRRQMLSAFSDAQLYAFIVAATKAGTKALSNELLWDIIVVRAAAGGLTMAPLSPDLARLLGAHADGKELVVAALEMVRGERADRDAWLGSFNWELIVEKPEGSAYILDICHRQTTSSALLPMGQIHNAMRYWRVAPCPETCCNHCGPLRTPLPAHGGGGGAVPTGGL